MGAVESVVRGIVHVVEDVGRPLEHVARGVGRVVETTGHVALDGAEIVLGRPMEVFVGIGEQVIAKPIEQTIDLIGDVTDRVVQVTERVTGLVKHVGENLVGINKKGSVEERIQQIQEAKEQLVEAKQEVGTISSVVSTELSRSSGEVTENLHRLSDMLANLSNSIDKQSSHLDENLEQLQREKKITEEMAQTEQKKLELEAQLEKAITINSQQSVTIEELTIKHIKLQDELDLTRERLHKIDEDDSFELVNRSGRVSPDQIA